MVLGTGGTIAGVAAVAGDNVGYAAAQVGVQALLAQATAGGEVGTREVRAEQVAQIDSKDMDFAVWRTLALRCQHHLDDPQVGAVVVTHGTDTLEETAWFLHCVLKADKPVVLTCAMRPATALAPDGPQNLRDAMVVACAAGLRGVWVVCAGEVHGAQQVQKVHPYRPNAFSSGESGPLGWVEEKTLRWAQNEAPAQARSTLVAIKDVAQCASWPRVEITMSYAGASAATVEALVASSVEGLVVAATGNGTVHRALQGALRQAQAQGVAVRLATRCPLGQTIAHPEGDGFDFPCMPGLSPVKARISLMLELAAAQAPG
ncbi:MAG: asparaginase [Burkholderiaceae bacterium]|nr:asparaginase [Burkholderiaceae bacterium]